MRVLVGGNDYYGYNESICHAFSSCGWEVLRSYIEYGWASPRLVDRMKYRWMPRFGYRGFSAADLETQRSRFMATALSMDLDLILVIKPDFMSPAMVQQLRARHPNAVLTAWMMDPIARSGDAGLVLPEFDHIFVYDEADLSFRKDWGPRVHPLLLCFDPRIHRGIQPLARPRYKLSFLGNLSDSRLKILEQVCRDLELAPGDVKIIGGSWAMLPILGRRRLNQRSWLFRQGYVTLKTVTGTTADRLYRDSAICLNLHQVGTAQGYNMRVFEVAGSAGFQIVDRLEGIDRVFEPDREIVIFDSPEDLVKKMRYYLERPEERIAIARAAAIRAHDRDTYQHRIRFILEICGLAQALV